MLQEHGNQYRYGKATKVQQVDILGCLQLPSFIESVINSKGSSHPNKEEKPLGSMYIPDV
jgi:hypothetical protein